MSLLKDTRVHDAILVKIGSILPAWLASHKGSVHNWSLLVMGKFNIQFSSVVRFELE